MKKILVLFFLLLVFILAAEDHLEWITANPDTIYFDDNVTFSIIQAMVADENNEPVAGANVYFDCDIGNLLHNATTNDEGIAETEFWESDELGVATITVERNSEYLETEVTIILPVSVQENEIISPISNLRNYPNPFNPSTTISFSLAAEKIENTELTIYNLKGEKVKTLGCGKQVNVSSKLVMYSITWDGTDQTNKPISSGVYFYKLQSGKFEQTKKMLLMK